MMVCICASLWRIAECVIDTIAIVASMVLTTEYGEHFTVGSLY